MQGKKWFWQQPDWLSTPNFKEKTYMFANQLMEREKQLIHNMGADTYKSVIVQSMADNLKASYAIEGETLDGGKLRSSIMEHMNMDIPEWRKHRMSRSDREDKAVQATLSLLNDEEALTPEKLCRLHSMLQHESEGLWGQFRTFAEYVMDGDNVVYEAPPENDVPNLVQNFCKWWNEDRPKLPAPIGSALGHAFFVVIHPFEDGNGRMARLLADKAMALGMDEPYRPYSMSSVIYQGRFRYYEALDKLPEENGVQDFVTLMTRLQSDVIDKALLRADALKKMEAIISISEEQGEAISSIGRAMLKVMAFDPERKSWSVFDASRDIEDVGDEDVWDVWDNLEARGIIKDGNINFTIFEKENIRASQAQEQDTGMSQDGPNVAEVQQARTAHGQDFKIGQTVTFQPKESGLKLTGTVEREDESSVTLKCGCMTISIAKGKGTFTEAPSLEKESGKEYAKDLAMKSLGSEGKVLLARNKGAYTGPIIGMTSTFAIQKVNENTAVLHRLKDLQTQDKDAQGLIKEGEDLSIVKDGTGVSISRTEARDRDNDKVRTQQKTRGSMSR